MYAPSNPAASEPTSDIREFARIAEDAKRYLQSISQSATCAGWYVVAINHLDNAVNVWNTDRSKAIESLTLAHIANNNGGNTGGPSLSPWPMDYRGDDLYTFNITQSQLRSVELALAENQPALARKRLGYICQKLADCLTMPHPSWQPRTNIRERYGSKPG